jgi:hypothetical protein
MTLYIYHQSCRRCWCSRLFGHRVRSMRDQCASLSTSRQCTPSLTVWLWRLRVLLRRFGPVNSDSERRPRLTVYPARSLPAATGRADGSGRQAGTRESHHSGCATLCPWSWREDGMHRRPRRWWCGCGRTAAPRRTRRSRAMRRMTRRRIDIDNILDTARSHCNAY